MKTRFLLLCGLLLGAGLTPAPAQTAEPATASLQLTAEQLEQLLGPIALYPDALIALILPAATAPADIVLAARFLHENGDTANITGRSWDESVKSLTHFPSVLKWMDQNLAWTKQVGEAFRDQPAEVMQAIQRLRARARAAGTLGDSAQQQVVVDGEIITIIPTQPNAIYIPYYDPTIVYYRPASFYPNTYLSFGPGIVVGSWLSFEFDWRNRTIWNAPRRVINHDQRDWRRPVFPGQPGYVADPDRRPWRPTPTSPRPPTFGRVDRPHDDGGRPTHPTNPPGERKDSPARRDGPSTRDRGTPPALVATPPTPETATPSPAVTPPARRRFEPSRDRNDTLDQSNRVSPRPTSPAAQPTAESPRHFPYGKLPSGPVVAPMSGPVVAPMPPPAARVSPPPPAAAPTRTPAAGPPEERRRDGGDGSERKREQPN